MSTKKAKANSGNVPRKKITAKRKRYSNLDLNSFQVPLSNKFDALSDNEDITDQSAAKPKEIKVSPIVVTDHSIDINKLTKEMNISCEIKILSIGRKIFAKTIEDKTKICEALNAKSVNFFSHPDSGDKIFKVVLSGLPEIDIKTITDCLTTDYGLIAKKIIMFNTKSSNKLYLCEFDSAVVNMKKLNDVNAVYHHRVKWLAYKQTRNGPTQCRRCLMFGHGQKFCNRYTACGLCSGNHLTSECTVISVNTKNPTYKCFNCASAKLPHTHRADDETCPFRAKYMETRTNAKTKSKRGTSEQKRDNINTNVRNERAPAPTSSRTSFANAVSNGKIQPNIQQASTSSAPNSFATTSTHNDNSNNDLFSIAEVSQILFNSIRELQQCKTKLDQLMVIANILQYACK